MKYQVHFQRTGVETVKSDLFETFQEAQSFAAKQQVRLLADIIAIVEIHEDGAPGEVHQVTVMTGNT